MSVLLTLNLSQLSSQTIYAYQEYVKRTCNNRFRRHDLWFGTLNLDF